MPCTRFRGVTWLPAEKWFKRPVSPLHQSQSVCLSVCLSASRESNVIPSHSKQKVRDGGKVGVHSQRFKKRGKTTEIKEETISSFQLNFDFLKNIDTLLLPKLHRTNTPVLLVVVVADFIFVIAAVFCAVPLLSLFSPILLLIKFLLRTTR